MQKFSVMLEDKVWFQNGFSISSLGIEIYIYISPVMTSLVFPESEMLLLNIILSVLTSAAVTIKRSPHLFHTLSLPSNCHTQN